MPNRHREAVEEARKFLRKVYGGHSSAIDEKSHYILDSLIEDLKWEQDSNYSDRRRIAIGFMTAARNQFKHMNRTMKK